MVETIKTGQYYFETKRGKFVIAPNPLEVVNGELTGRILRVRKTKQVLIEAIQYTTGDWDRVWKNYIDTLKRDGIVVDIGGCLVDRNDLNPSKFLHKKCNI